MGIYFINHNVYPDQILVRKFVGRVEVDQIISSWEYLIYNDLLATGIKGLLNDLTNCELEMNMDGFEKLISYLKRHKIFHHIKLAVVCHDPKTIVFPMLGEIEVRELQIKPFSSEIAAVKWIIG